DPHINIDEQLRDKENADLYRPYVEQRVKDVKKYMKKYLDKTYREKRYFDYIYTIPDTPAGRGLGSRISQAIDIGNKLGAIIDLRKKIKEREDMDNDFRQNFEKWFDVNFRQYYVKDLPNPIKPSEFFTIEKFKKA